MEGLEKEKRDNNQSPETVPSESSPLPDKATLEFILDELQRIDTEGSFRQPVDRSVFHYYDIAEPPTDFGTIRAKLRENKYRTLEQFEREVMLVPQNAMNYNSSVTMYFRQARGINELAKRLFQKLRNDPSELAQKTRALTGSSSRSVHRKRNRNSNTHLEQGTEKITDEELCGRRLTYRPWNCLRGENEKMASLAFGLPKHLDLVDTSIGYAESLNRFAKDLGPVAQKIVAKKLERLSFAQATTHPFPGLVDSSSNSWSCPDNFNGSGRNLADGGVDSLNIKTGESVGAISTGSAHIAALTDTSRIQGSAAALGGAFKENMSLYLPNNHNLQQQQQQYQQQYELSCNAAITNVPGDHVPFPSEIHPARLGVEVLQQQHRTNPAALRQGFQNESYTQLLNQMNVEALEEQQQMELAQQPLLGSMFGAGTSHAGPSSTQQNQQGTANVDWHGQLQDSERTRDPDLNLQLCINLDEAK